jgi:hypothetical protein
MTTPVLLVGALIIVGALFFAMSDRHSTSGGGNVTQQTNPTNAPGTNKQP